MPTKLTGGSPRKPAKPRPNPLGRFGVLSVDYKDTDLWLFRRTRR